MRDQTFPLKPWVLRSYPGRLLQLLEIIYNYSHSRTTRVIANAFGILIAMTYVMTCLCLHTTAFTKTKSLSR